MGVWTQMMLLRTGTSGRSFRNSNEISGFEYMGNYWLAGDLLASQEGLCSKVSVSYLVSQSSVRDSQLVS